MSTAARIVGVTKRPCIFPIKTKQHAITMFAVRGYADRLQERKVVRPLQPPAVFKPSMLPIKKKHHVITRGRTLPPPTPPLFQSHACLQ